MKRYAVLLLLASPAFGQFRPDVNVLEHLSNLPPACDRERPYYVRDGVSATDCSTGDGNTLVMCVCDSGGASYTGYDPLSPVAAAHAASHIENAADELTAEALGTACDANEAVTSDGAGGLDCTATVNWESAGAGTIDATNLPSETRSRWFPPEVIEPDGSQCLAKTSVTINSGPKLQTWRCLDNDAATFQSAVWMPDSWDGGTLTLGVVYVQTSATSGLPLHMDVAMQCRGNGETISATWGTEVAIDDAALVGSNAVEQTTSGSVTPAGTCNPGDLLIWRVQIDAAGTEATVGTIRFLGARLTYTVENT